ncbi:MAG TPA: hypothetical protein VKV95_19745 [Terriglobia bacterium]|nr:hypothetical protein [Terriglobia bacterium]
MNRHTTFLGAIVAGGILSAGLIGYSGQELKPGTNAEPYPRTATGRIQNMWVSETTGKQYHVTVEGDIFRAEWLNVPGEWVAQGAFIRTECKRHGNKWIGTSTSYMPWSSQKGTEAKVKNWCHLETKFEVDSITEETISGRGESVRKFDAGACKILKAGMSDFQWSPDK